MNKIQILGYLGWLKVEREEMEKEGRKERGKEIEKKSEKQGEICEIFTRMQYIIYILIRSCMGQKKRESCELIFFFFSILKM